MSTNQRLQPNPGEIYTQAFEALDTVVEDRKTIDDTYHLLEADCQNNPDDSRTLFEMYQEELANLDPRVKYTLSKLGELTVSATEQFSYIQKYVSTLPKEERVMAERRALWYISLLNRYLKAGGIDEREFRGNVPTNRQFSAKKEPSVGWHLVKKITGRRDPETGRIWVNMGDPRAVQVEKGQSTITDRVVASYEIVQLNDSFVDVRLPAGEGTQRIAFNGQPNGQYRLSQDGNRLELYIPRDRKSLPELDILTDFQDLGISLLSAREAGAAIRNIWESYDSPNHANPVPLNVAKRN